MGPSWLAVRCQFCLLLILPPLVLPLTFNYSSMGNSAAQYLTQIGNVSYTPDYVELTWFSSNPRLSAGRVYNNEQLSLWDSDTRQTASFNCSFEFAIVLQDDTSADGLAFFLLDPSLSQIPLSKGGSLGLLNDTNDGTEGAGFVAVEFDTFQNYFDPSSNHVGIDINSVNSSTSSNLAFPLATSSAVYAWVDYSNSTSLLQVYATNVSSDKPSSPLISQSVNFSQLLPEEVLIGFSAATGAWIQYHRILSWSFNSTTVANDAAPSSISSNSGSNTRLIVILVLACAAVVAISLFLFFYLRRKKRPRIARPMSSGIGMASSDGNYGPRDFNYTELKAATGDFSDEFLLGEGGFGSVYRGVSRFDGSSIAVKRISKKSNQGEREFSAEVNIISRIRHKNLVQLKGWCRDQSNLLLVYEYLPKGSLDQHLFSKDPSLVLNWSTRYNIVCGLGSALQYLHQECEKVIVHRDIKASNVMLDANYNAKLGDFGLARQFGEGIDGHTTIAAGTVGYMAPETYGTGRATTESDVYSYGIVLLEVVCGRRPIHNSFRNLSEGYLLDWVWGLNSEGRLREASDAQLAGDFDEEQLVRTLTVGLACAHPDPKERPSIDVALAALQGRAPVPVVPSSKPVAHYGPPPPSTNLFSRSSISNSGPPPIYSSSSAPDTDTSERALLN